MKKILSLIGIALMTANLAHAETVSYTFTNNDGLYDTPTQSQTGELNLFDLSLGSLTGVSFSLTGHGYRAGSIDMTFTGGPNGYKINETIELTGGEDPVSTSFDVDAIDIAWFYSSDSLKSFNIDCKVDRDPGESYVGCNGEVTYTYTTQSNHVPEPGSLALLALALGGAGFASRRRKSA